MSVTYYLAQADDGRITLDRECHGNLLKAITVSAPSSVRREIEGELVDVPQYWESYSKARAQVSATGYEHIRGNGWFAAKEK
jgi:hypothetical protein